MIKKAVGPAKPKARFVVPAIALFGLATIVTGCATVKLEAPDKPIEINLNINITQELRVKLDKDIQDLIADNPDIF